MPVFLLLYRHNLENFIHRVLVTPVDSQFTFVAECFRQCFHAQWSRGCKAWLRRADKIPKTSKQLSTLSGYFHTKSLGCFNEMRSIYQDYTPICLRKIVNKHGSQQWLKHYLVNKLCDFLKLRGYMHTETAPKCTQLYFYQLVWTGMVSHWLEVRIVEFTLGTCKLCEAPRC